MRDVILCDPHADVLPSLNRHLDDLGGLTEVNLKVLVTIVNPCTPGPHVFSTPHALKPTQECCVVFVPLRRGLHLIGSEATVLQSHWLVAKFSWWHDKSNLSQFQDTRHFENDTKSAIDNVFA